MNKPLESYTLDEYRELRKGSFLMALFILVVVLGAMYGIFYMGSNGVPQSKIHSFVTLSTSVTLVAFWSVVWPKSNKVAKLLKLHPEWNKQKIMNAPLTSTTLTQLIGVPLFLAVVIAIGFSQFYQPQQVIDTETIPSVEIPDTSSSITLE